MFLTIVEIEVLVAFSIVKYAPATLIAAVLTLPFTLPVTLPVKLPVNAFVSASYADVRSLAKMFPL